MGPQGPSGAAGTVGPKVNIHSDNSKHFVVKQGTFFNYLEGRGALVKIGKGSLMLCRGQQMFQSP